MKNPKQKQIETKIIDKGENLNAPSRKEALKALAKAKKIEADKLTTHEWITSDDGKTSVLKKKPLNQ